MRLAKEWFQAQGNHADTSSLPAGSRIYCKQSSRRTVDDESVVFKTDGAWNASTKTVGLRWSFTGPLLKAPSQGSAIHTSVSSPLIAEALAMRSALCMAITLEFSTLKFLSDNSTLIRAINGKSQSKEIIGIVK